MKVILLISLLLPLFNFKQDEKFPEGCYMSWDEIVVRKPSITCKIKVKPVRLQPDSSSLGYDLFLQTVGGPITPADLDEKVWAYSDGYDLYLNCWNLKFRRPFYAGYQKVITNGRFLAFYKNEVSEEMKSANYATAFGVLMGGAAGGLLAGAIAHRKVKHPMDKYLYVVDMGKAKRYEVDSSYLEKTLKNFPDVYDKFKSDADRNTFDKQLEYLQMANEAK